MKKKTLWKIMMITHMLPVDFALNGEFEIIYQYDRNEVPTVKINMNFYIKI